MSLVDQLPCGSVLTPAISCTKFKFFSSLIFREDQSLLHRPRNSGRDCAWWTNSLVGQYLHQQSLLQIKVKIHSAHTDSPMAKTDFFFLLQVLERTNLCLTDPKLKRRMFLVDQLPFESVLIPAISCTRETKNLVIPTCEIVYLPTLPHYARVSRLRI